MIASRMKTVEYFKEFVDTQVSVGALVEIYYLRYTSNVMVYTNMKFRIATSMHLDELKDFLKDYPHIKRKRNTLTYFELKEVK